MVPHTCPSNWEEAEAGGSRVLAYATQQDPLSNKTEGLSWAWLAHIVLIPEKLRQEDYHKVEARHGYSEFEAQAGPDNVRFYLKK